MRVAKAVLGSAIVLAGIYLLARKTTAKPCVDMEPGPYRYFTYVGPRQTVMAALGECYPVIYTLEVYDPETGDWWPPADPVHDILEPESWCRVIVQQPCTLCGFEPRE